MDLLILIDTTSDFSQGVVYRPKKTISILRFLINSYYIGPWDTHIGIASFDGNKIENEIYPDDFGSDPKVKNSRDLYIDIWMTKHLNNI